MKVGSDHKDVVWTQTHVLWPSTTLSEHSGYLILKVSSSADMLCSSSSAQVKVPKLHTMNMGVVYQRNQGALYENSCCLLSHVPPCNRMSSYQYTDERVFGVRLLACFPRDSQAVLLAEALGHGRSNPAHWCCQ